MTGYDRFGDPIEQLDDDSSDYYRPTPALHQCDNGWIDRNADQPRPCLVCKPHLSPQARARRLDQSVPAPVKTRRSQP